ncbi:DNA primase [Vibrio phage VCPH]|nr:DNA primase [Vibrio phage VCPH]
MQSNVQDVLDRKGIEYKEKGEDFLVHCINPEHEDSHPSLRIDHMTGIFHCFSCGVKGNIFEWFGEYQSKTYDLLAEVSREIDNIMIESVGLDIPESSVPFEEEFRGIKPEIFQKFYAFTHTDPEFVNRVVFPIPDVSGKILGFIGRYTHSNVSPKYRVEPPGAKLPIYPIPQADHVVFVEGLFDVLNLHDKGLYTACALFGTHNLTGRNIKEKLAPLQASGVVRVFLLLDKDRAGTDSALKLTNLIERNTDMKVYDVSDVLDEGQDPGALSQSEVDFLVKYIEKVVAQSV